MAMRYQRDIAMKGVTEAKDSVVTRIHRQEPAIYNHDLETMRFLSMKAVKCCCAFLQDSEG